MKQKRRFAVFDDQDVSDPAIRPALFTGSRKECESFVREFLRDTGQYRFEPLLNCSRKQTTGAASAPNGLRPLPGGMQRKCYFDNELCSGELWRCRTCRRKYCRFHTHQSDKGIEIECAACERIRLGKALGADVRAYKD